MCIVIFIFLFLNNKFIYTFVSYNHFNFYVIIISTKLFKSKCILVTLDIGLFNI